MKKLTLLLTACAITMMSFAAGGNITYVLNGGVTNDDGWTNKADMLVGLNQDFNTQYAIDPSATWYTWETLPVILGAADPVVRIPTFATKMYDVMATPKWQWLRDYIVATVATQKLGGNQASVEGGTLDVIQQDAAADAYWRYNVSSFFVSSQRTGWPVSANYAVAGQPDAFIPSWQHAFSGPASYDGSVDITLPDPFKADESFLGWYDNAAFTGSKITKIDAGTDGDITLYARWGTYIATVAETKGLPLGSTTSTQGVVTYISASETSIYIQDATGGLLVELVEPSQIAVGEKIIVAGTVAANGAYVKLAPATLSNKENGELPSVQNITLVTLKADAASYMYEYVNIQGLTIVQNNGAVVDLEDADGNSITLNTVVDQATYSVGIKVNVKGIVGYTTDVVLFASSANVTLAPVPRKDPATYAPIQDGKYTLTSKWLVSNVMDNLVANPVGSANFVRGMAAQDGKMYFVDRELKQLTVIDGQTGERLAPIKLASNIFRFMDGDVEKDAGTLPFNDIKIDNAGNILLGNCITSNAQPFQVWKIDLATGNGTLILHDILKDNENFEAPASLRFDAFGVWGDVTGDGIIMAASASAMEAYKWTFKNGQLESSEVVIIDTSEPGTFITGLTNPGTAPQIFPLDEDYFYLDGNATLPTLMDMDGNVVDGFYNVPKEVEDWSVGTGNKAGHNGLIEFEVGGEYFFLVASGNTLATPPSTFRLFKWKDANKEFKDIESLWSLPAAGMGSASNAYRTAVPSVEVDEANGIATLYLFTGENGYGVYEFKVNVTDGVARVNNNTIKIAVNEKTLSFKEPMASVTVYSVSGQLQVKATHVSSVKLANQGVYLVKVKTIDGVNEIHKVIVK